MRRFIITRWSLMHLFLNKEKVTRIESRFPDLYQELKHARKENISTAFIEVVECAYNQLHFDDLYSILTSVKQNTVNVDQQQIELIARLRDEYDHTYFTLMEREDSMDDKNVTYNFKISRFLAAIHFYVTQKCMQDLNEAFFEILFAFDDPDAMCQRVIKQYFSQD